MHLGPVPAAATSAPRYSNPLREALNTLDRAQDFVSAVRMASTDIDDESRAAAIRVLAEEIDNHLMGAAQMVKQAQADGRIRS